MLSVVVKVNTLSMDFDSRGINHTEGGWPKDVNHLDVEQVGRYRKKVEKDVSYVNVIGGLGTVINFHLVSIVVPVKLFIIQGAVVFSPHPVVLGKLILCNDHRVNQVVQWPPYYLQLVNWCLSRL